MKAVILAAGKGTRMGDITKNIPKPMIEVAGKPVIEHIICGLMSAGITEFILITRYLTEKIEAYLGNGSAMGAKISYVPQSDRYGTGAALLEAKSLTGGGPVLMTYGDIITPPANYAGALSTFAEKNGEAVITLNWMDDPWAGGAVHVDDDSGKVAKIVEKPPKGKVISHWNSAGIFVFKSVIFHYLEKLQPSPRGEYELPDALNAMVRDGLSVYPYYLQGRWQDVGRPEDIPVAEDIIKQST